MYTNTGTHNNSTTNINSIYANFFLFSHVKLSFCGLIKCVIVLSYIQHLCLDYAATMVGNLVSRTKQRQEFTDVIFFLKYFLRRIFSDVMTRK